VSQICYLQLRPVAESLYHYTELSHYRRSLGLGADAYRSGQERGGGNGMYLEGCVIVIGLWEAF
jgi:hypothetical protein